MAIRLTTVPSAVVRSTIRGMSPAPQEPARAFRAHEVPVLDDVLPPQENRADFPRDVPAFVRAVVHGAVQVLGVRRRNTRGRASPRVPAGRSGSWKNPPPRGSSGRRNGTRNGPSPRRARSRRRYGARGSLGRRRSAAEGTGRTWLPRSPAARTDPR